MGTAEITELESESGCPKWKFLSATAIKLIAVVFMFMDHIHQMFVTAGAPIWLTMAGRLVFPIFLVALLSANENIPALTIRVLATLALLVPNILTVEGGFALVLLGVLFYIFREKRIIQILVLLILSALVFITGNKIQSMMGLAAIPMLMYNGKRGYGMKNFFYIFYPAHIGILYIISAMIM